MNFQRRECAQGRNGERRKEEWRTQEIQDRKWPGDCLCLSHGVSFSGPGPKCRRVHEGRRSRSECSPALPCHLRRGRETHTALDRFSQEGRHGTESSREPGPEPSRSGMNTLTARAPPPPPLSYRCPPCSSAASSSVSDSSRLSARCQPPCASCCLLYYCTGEGNHNHSSILAWRIPWMEESGRLQSMGSQRVRHDWANSHSLTVLLRYCTARLKMFIFCLCFLWITCMESIINLLQCSTTADCISWVPRLTVLDLQIGFTKALSELTRLWGTYCSVYQSIVPPAKRLGMWIFPASRQLPF